jgi:hypothetical protein
MAFIYDLTDTWNNAGISFNGIKLNATDTASAAGSKLLDLQINGASKLAVGKTGTVTATGIIESTVGGFKFPDATTQTTKATVNSVSGTGSVNGITLTGSVTNSGSLTLGGTLGNIANNQLSNSAITINGTSTALGGSIAVGTVTSVGGTGTVSGLSLTGSVTTTGSLTLGGTLVLTSGQVTDGLGYTPYNATNPTGYITAAALTPYLTSATAATTYQPLDGDLTAIAALAGTPGLIRKTAANTYSLDTAVYITGITSGDVTTALGFTPYNATNPAGYTTNVGTVTSVAALTLGTSGTDLASSVANGTTTPVITLNVPTASATNRGALSSSDWSTFNAKQAALVSGTNIKTVGGASLLGSGDVGTIGLAYGGTGATTDSGARTALGLGTAAVLNSGVAGGVATLDGSGTVPTSQLPGAVLGGLNYQGTWNASTNTPTLASSTGSKGYYYVVSVAGSTNLDGITDWKIGDWAVYDGSAWQKVDNTDAVSSVNGFTGAVVLTTSDVAQGTNLYFTQAAARGSVSAGTGISYDSGTGVITNSAPDQTVALTGAGTTTVTGTYPNFTVTSNDSTVGTVTSVGGTGTVSGLTLTGTVTTSGNLTLGGTLAVTPSNFASQTANTVLAAPNGAAGVPTFRAIVAADIPTLNQNTTGTASNVTGTVAVANGGTGATTLTSGYLVKGNGTSAVSASVVYDTGTNVGIGTSSPTAKLDVRGTSYVIGTGGTRVTDAVQANGFEVVPAATNNVLSYNRTTNGYLPIRWRAGVQSWEVDNVERMRITSAGLVGIGTATPNTKLAVEGSACEISINDTAGTIAGLRFRTSGSTKGVIQADSTSNLRFSSGSTEAMRILSSGNVGIGTATPGARLETSVTSAGATVEVLRLSNPGSGANTQAQINFYTTSTSYATITGGYGATAPQMTFNLPSATAGNYVWQISSVEQMRLDSAGNVGIGTSSPQSALNVFGSSGLTLNLANSGWQTAAIKPIDEGAAYQGALALYTHPSNASPTNPTERMRITSAGNVGIGTASPAARVDLGYTGGTVALRISRDASNRLDFYQGGGVSYIDSSPASAQLAFATVGTERMRINSSGNVGIGTSSPATLLHISATNPEFRLQGTNGTGSVHKIRSTGLNSEALQITSAGDIYYNANLQVFRAANEATEYMRITSAGNVGIGTTVGGSYGRNIHLHDPSTTSASVKLSHTGTGTGATDGLELIMSGLNGFLQNREAGFLSFGTSNAERMRIDTSGNLLVGTTSVAYTNTNSAFISVGNGCYNSQHASGTASGSYYAAFVYNATDIGSITQNGTTGVSYNTSSDYRLKDIDGPVANSGAYIDALNPVQGSWKADGSRFIGLLAHEVQEVSETPIATGEKDGEEMQAMDYSAPELIANLIAEIQSLRARVAQLEGN